MPVLRGVVTPAAQPNVSMPVSAVLDPGASASCVPPGVADELGVKEPWKTGPQVGLADGRRVWVTQMTAPLNVSFTTYRNGHYRICQRQIRFAVIPGEAHKMLIGSRTASQLQHEMDKNERESELVPHPWRGESE